jgi:hypothetical protein
MEDMSTTRLQIVSILLEGEKWSRLGADLLNILVSKQVKTIARNGISELKQKVMVHRQ